MSARSASADVKAERRLSLWIRVTATIMGIGAAGVVVLVAWLFVSQHSMIYHPRPYAMSYAHALPANGVEIKYVLPFGQQTAYYIPGRDPVPRRIWVAFSGNASLALDWTTLLRRYPSNDDGFLLIDYPGYGRNAGYASIDTTRATANAALSELLKRLEVDEDRIGLCVIGHSLGAAAGLDFAVRHAIQRIVLISPFTTLRDEAAYVVGRLLSRVLVENYDNRQNLRTVFQRNEGARIAIFHGTNDDTIPLRMGRELKLEFPAADFFPIEGADHGNVLYYAHDQIIAWMNR